MEDLYTQIDFIVSGGALKLLTDFLGSKNLPTLVIEPSGEDFQVLDAVGIIPNSLMVRDKDLHIRSLFSKNPPLAAFEVDQAKGNEAWPCVIRMRGAHWELYLLLAKEPESTLVEELHSYAGLVRIWRTFQRIDERRRPLVKGFRAGIGIIDRNALRRQVGADGGLPAAHASGKDHGFHRLFGFDAIEDFGNDPVIEHAGGKSPRPRNATT